MPACLCMCLLPGRERLMVLAIRILCPVLVCAHNFFARTDRAFHMGICCPQDATRCTPVCGATPTAWGVGIVEHIMRASCLCITGSRNICAKLASVFVVPVSAGRTAAPNLCASSCMVPGAQRDGADICVRTLSFSSTPSSFKHYVVLLSRRGGI